MEHNHPFFLLMVDVRPPNCDASDSCESFEQGDHVGCILVETQWGYYEVPDVLTEFCFEYDL
jgi:hypothetical protein